MYIEKEDDSLKFNNLYETINKIYSVKKPISRVLYITKLRESDKGGRETLTSLRDEIRKILKRSEEQFNIMIIYIGTRYALVAIEVIYN